MAYLNEFPHFESNKLNLDWLLEQYSTFNDRIEEIMTAFNKAVEDMEEEVADVKATWVSFKNEIENEFDNLTNTINNNFSNLEDDLQGEIDDLINNAYRQINTAITTMQATINDISENIETYINNNIATWFGESGYIENDITTSDWTVYPQDSSKLYTSITLNLVTFFDNPYPLFVKIGNDLGTALIVIENNTTEGTTARVIYQSQELNIVLGSDPVQIGMTQSNKFYRLSYAITRPVASGTIALTNANIINNTISFI